MSFEPFVWHSEAPDDIPFAESERWHELRFTGKSRHYPAADTFYPTWAGDGKLYSPFTDGTKMWICYSGNFATNRNGNQILPNPPDSGYGMVLQEVELLSR